MNKKKKKQQREDAIKAEKARRENDLLARSPLNKEQMLSLFTHVGSSIVKDGHDHDFTYTNGWLSDNGFDLPLVRDFLISLKIENDWDVLMSGDPLGLFGSSATHHVWMPLEKEDLQRLIEFLEIELEATGCSHKHSLTESWLSNTEYNIEQVIAALVAQGGYCDCEVTLNVESEGIYV